MDNEDLNWRAEEACINAWPCPRQTLLDGWLVRLAGGSTRRTNSVNPPRYGPPDPALLLDPCTDIYAAHGLPLLFRAPAIAPGLAGRLEALGFSGYDETHTIFADLEGALCVRDDAVMLTAAPTEDFYALRATVNGESEEATAVYRAMTGLIALPKAFATLAQDGAPVSIAYGAIDRGLLVIESVATDPAARGKGFARRTVSTLMHWAGAHGAWGACLQVLGTNEPARALYARLGFTRDLYRYHYARRENPL
jgi:ribosomal protein S18 acetylase RimI-like enzyme